MPSEVRGVIDEDSKNRHKKSHKNIYSEYIFPEINVSLMAINGIILDKYMF